MNKVSPILDEEFESSVDTLHRKIQLRLTHNPKPNQPSGPRTCRICLEEQATPANETPAEEEQQRELIIPCECKGSVGYVHQKCIKMWIQKQLQSNKSKRAYCQICKSEIFFKKIKIRYCECKLSNICDTSPCNVVCLIAQLILVGIVALVQYYVDRLMNFQLLRNTLLALLAILCATFILTLFLIVKQSFVKSYRQIQRIHSLAQSEQLGYRQPKNRPTANNLDITYKRRKIGVNRKGRQSGSSQRPLNPFESISPELVVTFN